MLMANVITTNRPEVVALIEEAARKLTRGDKIKAVALAVRRLLDENARAGSLFGAHRGSVRVHAGVDILLPALDVGARCRDQLIAFCSHARTRASGGLRIGHAALDQNLPWHAREEGPRTSSWRGAAERPRRTFQGQCRRNELLRPRSLERPSRLLLRKSASGRGDLRRCEAPTRTASRSNRPRTARLPGGGAAVVGPPASLSAWTGRPWSAAFNAGLALSVGGGPKASGRLGRRE